MTEIRKINRSDYPAWDQYVLGNPDAGVYLSSAWKDAVEASYGHNSYYLGAFQGEKLKGCLPLFHAALPLGIRGGALVSLPFCDYGGLFADGDEFAEALLEHAISLADVLGCGLEIRSAALIPALEEMSCFSQVTDKCRMVLPLPESSSFLWDGFKSKLRSQVKKASKEGLACRIGHTELLPFFYRVFSQNMRDLGSPVHSKKWLQSVLSAYRERSLVGLVVKDGKPAAAGIVISHGNTMTIPWASALREYNPLSPNMLLYWTLLQYACDNGFKYFDFGRSTPNEGTYAFKKQWGALPVKLYWYKQGVHSPGGERGAKSILRGGLEQGWARLPLAVANALGPRIRKYIDR